MQDMLNFMPEHTPDKVDRAIVAKLQEDGRMANVDLADAVAMSPSACLRRVKALEASGIIAGYHAEVSRVKAGLGLTVFIGLKVTGHSRENSQAVEQALTAIPAVGAIVIPYFAVIFANGGREPDNTRGFLEHRMNLPARRDTPRDDQDDRS